MIPNFDTKLLNSAYLWLDDRLTTAGLAYVNQSGTMFKQTDTARGLVTYTSPYKGWVYNACSTGATIPSGVYTTSGQLLTRQSGIFFDFNNGRILSSGNWGGTVSGNWAQKEYNVYTSNEEDTTFYLESLYKANQDLVYTQTGVPPYNMAAPCIIITKAFAENTPVAFGGQETSARTLRLYAISDDFYHQDALAGLLVDAARSYFPLVENTDMPLTFYGDTKGGYYSYCDIKNRLGCRDVFIKNCYAIKLPTDVNKNTYFSIQIIEMDLEVVRFPRG